MAAKQSDKPWRQETLAIHAGGLKSTVFGEVSPPVFQTSTFAFPSAEAGAARFSGEQPGYIYTRMNNPTVNALEAAVAALEGGAWAVAASTGMAAVNAVLFSLLSQGEGVLAGDCLYGPSHTLIDKELPRFGIAPVFVDCSNLEDWPWPWPPAPGSSFWKPPPTPP